MADKILDFIQRRRKTKLYKQWVQMDSLPQEDVPQEITSGKKERQAEWSDAYAGDFAEEDRYRTARREDADSGLVPFPIRYILLGGGLITILLVVIAVLITVLIMRSC